MIRLAAYVARAKEAPPAESPCYTEAERAYCLSRANPLPSLVARYAAKRAALAALSLPPDAPLEEIEVARERRGAPLLLLHGSAGRAAREQGLTRAHVSLTHSGEYAAALVVVE